MLRMLFFLGLAFIAFVVGSVVLSVLFGFAIGVLVLAVKVLVLVALAYLAIRIISPATAASLRGAVERETLHRF